MVKLRISSDTVTILVRSVRVTKQVISEKTTYQYNKSPDGDIALFVAHAQIAIIPRVTLRNEWPLSFGEMIENKIMLVF